MPVPVSLLGLSSEHPDVQAFLKSIQATPPNLPDGDIDVNTSAPAKGLTLVFTDESAHTNNDDLALGEGELLLTNITFLTSRSKGFDTYAGALPFGARFDMTRAELRALLGQPEESDDDLCLDRWTVDGIWFFATYADDFSELKDCAVQLPDPEDK